MKNKKTTWLIKTEYKNKDVNLNTLQAPVT